MCLGSGCLVKKRTLDWERGGRGDFSTKFQRPCTDPPLTLGALRGTSDLGQVTVRDWWPWSWGWCPQLPRGQLGVQARPVKSCELPGEWDSRGGWPWGLGWVVTWTGWVVSWTSLGLLCKARKAFVANVHLLLASSCLHSKNSFPPS